MSEIYYSMFAAENYYVTFMITILRGYTKKMLYFTSRQKFYKILNFIKLSIEFYNF